MAILEFLGLSGQPNKTEDKSNFTSDLIRKIASKLDELPETRAQFLAIFAYVLGRAAHADSHISPEETQKISSILQTIGHIPTSQANIVVELAKHQVVLFGGTENYVVTKRFRELSTPKQRLELLECAFAVSAADHSITAVEEGEVRKISKELRITHSEFSEAKAAYLQHLEALKLLRSNI